MKRQKYEDKREFSWVARVAEEELEDRLSPGWQHQSRIVETTAASLPTSLDPVRMPVHYFWRSIEPGNRSPILDHLANQRYAIAVDDQRNLVVMRLYGDIYPADLSRLEQIDVTLRGFGALPRDHDSSTVPDQ